MSLRLSLAEAQRVTDTAFEEGGVRVLRVTHLAATGFDRPVFDLDLEGVPPGWAER